MDNEEEQSELGVRLDSALHRRSLESSRQQVIRAILNRSVGYGRASRILGENPDDAMCQEYVDQVITFYDKYNKFIACLERQEPDAWKTITLKINRWAKSYFRSKNIYGRLRKKAVREIVPNSVLAYLSGTYHYDTDFNAWFCVLVHNVCRRYIKEQLHPNRVNQREALSVDKSDTLLEVLADEKAIESDKTRELRLVLLEAIEKLSSEARKELIIRYYFSGYSFKEIAAEMGKSLNAIYKLHFDALNEMRDIFDTQK